MTACLSAETFVQPLMCTSYSAGSVPYRAGLVARLHHPDGMVKQNDTMEGKTESSQ